MTEFERIYQTYFRDVFRYAKRLSGNESVAEDITSETFFRALRAIDTFRGDCDIRVWLCQIAKNCFYTYCRKNPEAVSLEAEETGGSFRLLDVMEDCTAEHMEERLERREDAMQIHSVLHSLKEPYKEVFTLRVFGELSFKQIGRLFGKTENWACVTYYRAKNKILKKLEEHHENSNM